MQKTDSRTRSLPIKIRLTSDNKKKDPQVITGMVYESKKNMMIIY